MKTCIDAKPRLAILTNILAANRVHIFRSLADRFESTVLTSGSEDNRSWDQASLGDGLTTRKVWGVTVKSPIRSSTGSTEDLRYLHINPGYIPALLRLRPDAIISSEMGFRTLISLAYGFVFRVPVWVGWGGTLHTEHARSVSKRMLRRLIFIPLVSRWISYGQSSSDYLHAMGVDAPRILQTQNCVDEQLFHRNCSELPLDLPGPRMLFVGQMIGRKGIDHLLQAAGHLVREGLKFSLVMVGDGPESGHVKDEAARLGIEHFLWMSYIPPEEMASVYAACDFLVFPTLEDVWGLVVNESLLCGTPVLASRFAGCAHELLPSGNIFDPLDAEEFTRLLRRSLTLGVPPADLNPILRTKDVARLIADDIQAALAQS